MFLAEELHTSRVDFSSQKQSLFMPSERSIRIVEHRTHRGALWASGAAQAAHVVRIILRWLDVCEGRARL